MQDIERRGQFVPGVPVAKIVPYGSDYVFLKRAMDLVFATLLLLCCGVFIVLIAILITLFSPGPIIYRQKRIGLKGEAFEMLKFRTMTCGNSDSSHREHVQRLIRENLSPADLGTQSLKITGDKRVTWIGKVLRATSLDELPQLFNVLQGQMSLVGPRPPLPYEYELYNEWHKQRLNVRPGITGLWQVTAHNRVSFDEMVQLDLAYIDTMNPWLDFMIIIQTPNAMLRGE